MWMNMPPVGRKQIVIEFRELAEDKPGESPSEGGRPITRMYWVSDGSAPCQVMAPDGEVVAGDSLGGLANKLAEKYGPEVA